MIIYVFDSLSHFRVQRLNKNAIKSIIIGVVLMNDFFHKKFPKAILFISLVLPFTNELFSCRGLGSIFS